MKAKKLTLLIALIALIGTFTSVIPPQTFANTGPNDFCLPIFGPAASPQNPDTHNLTPNIISTSTVQLQSLYDSSNNVKTSVLTFFINVNTGTETTPVLGVRQGSIDSTLELVSSMKLFTGTIAISGENNYVGFVCGRESESDSTPAGTVVPGLHHSQTITFRIDRTDPTISCQNLNFNQLETDVGLSIPRTDSRFNDFFGANVVVNDNLDDNVDRPLFGNAPVNIPVGQTVRVTFTATDDGDIPTPGDGNTATATCEIFITQFEREGCIAVVLDELGKPTEVEVCLEIPVKQADCGLAILATTPSLAYGILDQDDTSETQLLQVRNDGNAPALLKVIAGDEFDQLNTPGFWIKPDEPLAPPFTKQMEAFRTHFSTVDRGTTDAATFYDSGDSFPVSDTDKTIIIPILDPNVITDLFWQLRILLENPLFFGNMQQTLTLELQECSVANECELLGQTCPNTGDIFGT